MPTNYLSLGVSTSRGGELFARASFASPLHVDLSGWDFLYLVLFEPAPTANLL